jgi:hypothetical protein
MSQRGNGKRCLAPGSKRQQSSSWRQVQDRAGYQQLCWFYASSEQQLSGGRLAEEDRLSVVCALKFRQLMLCERDCAAF